METLYPLLFNETLTDDIINTGECGDGIYVSDSRFRLFMGGGGADAANEESLVVISIKCGDRSVNTFIKGTHTEAPECVFAPSWICNVLGCNGGETVELGRAYPSIGSKITIKPHTSGYSLLDDPVSELRNAFENYSCLSAGLDIPLNVAGETLVVSIIDVGSEGPICIRGVELEVEIETPLDKEAEELEAAIAATEEERLSRERAHVEAVEAAEAHNRFLKEEAERKAKELDAKRFPGIGRRLDGKNTS
jgi:hypothetical protein